MQCPLCRETALEPRFAQGIEVDVCPRCRGLWLDRGELERLLGEGGEAPPAAAPAAAPDRRQGSRARPDRYDRDDRYDERHDDDRRYGPRRKKSKAKRLADMFEEVLDF